MKRCWVIPGLLILSFAAFGEERKPVLLELFTSEGCSSCPPADQLLEKLDQKQPFGGADLIVLSEHVDYWNSGGWRDPFSSKFYSLRQRNYATLFGLESVYTPQLVVDGSAEGVGSNVNSTKASVAKALAQRKVSLSLENVKSDGGTLSLHATAGSVSAEDGAVTLYLALAEGKVRSDVQGGENGGRSLTHVAVVRALMPVATVTNGSNLSKDIHVKLPSFSSGELRVVAFLQEDKSGKIIGATQTRL